MANTKIISLRVKVEQLLKLKLIAEKEERSISYLIGKAIDEYIKNKEKASE